MTIKYYSKTEIQRKIKRLLKPCDTLVDVGCGINPFRGISCKVHICIEPWKEYIDIISHCHSSKPHYVFIHADALAGLQLIPDHSVDTICMIDLIEHLKKEDGIQLIKECDRIACKQIIIFTPLGFMPNHTGDKDAWGLNGAQLQTHQSGWLPEDFDNTWDLHVCEKYHLSSSHHAEIAQDFGCIWAIKNKNIKLTPKQGTPQFVIENRDCNHISVIIKKIIRKLFKK